MHIVQRLFVGKCDSNCKFKTLQSIPFKEIFPRRRGGGGEGQSKLFRPILQKRKIWDCSKARDGRVSFHNSNLLPGGGGGGACSNEKI